MNIKGNIFGRFYIDRRIAGNNPILICGTHRSGSTWLAEIINRTLRYRYIEEPIRMAKDLELQIYNRRYLRPGKFDEYMSSFFKSIVEGKRQRFHLNRKNQHFICRGTLIKDVGINLMLKWLRQEFPTVKIIYILRDPFLVVNSSINTNWLSPKEPSFWWSQKELVEDYLYNFEDIIKRTNSDIEKFVLEWCILNLVPIKQFSENDWKMVLYSDLIKSPEKTLGVIFRHIDSPYDRSILQYIKKPSHTSEDLEISTMEAMLKWQKNLSKQEISTIEKYVSLFGLDLYL
jgi:hypothetical protein